MQTVPYILGIAHPTGFPGYTLLGWLYAHVVPIGTVAWRMNLLSALATTATCWFVYRILVEREIEPEFAAGSALLFAFTKIAWEHATRRRASRRTRLRQRRTLRAPALETHAQHARTCVVGVRLSSGALHA